MQTNEPTPPAAPAELDEATLEWVRKVFQYARSGDAEPLGALLAQGLPPNLRNERGDSLLMLACYHGHHDAARVLLEHGADPQLMNDAAQTPLHGAAFKATWRSPPCCSITAPSPTMRGQPARRR